ncbi:glycosyltransferase family 2 protein [Acrocarpospora macrocephala]|uniref:glycosyltransferase family 2 protein n=1 Tax=Acrocarpospora macrocephala TaxID=150177 RepID=UPI001C3FE45B|nr:glycosyltransferase family 2 protein [Acrocarpospora macrocephala]
MILTASAALTMWWMLHAWRTPETLHATRFSAPDGEQRMSFSLLVPARMEENVLAATVTGLLQSTHRDFEILVIVGHDDPGTAAIAAELARDHPDQVRVITDTNPRKNKPKALNTALPHCTGEIVGVFDAEDEVHPLLLEHVDHEFRKTRADVLQGGVQLINFHSSWYSLRNCMEYFFWFRSRLHLHARMGFIPLGGNTVFVRTEVLRENGGWDQDCLAEDCDLGVRLSTRGKKFAVAYDAVLVTREETPGSIKALVKQRTRWNQGFLQVLRKGEWKALPTLRQRLLARFTLTSPFIQAFTGAVIPVGILAGFLLDVPDGVALITFLPLLPTLTMLAFELAGLHEFGGQYGVRVRAGHYAKLIAGLPLYQLILAVAALRSVWRESTGRGDWELTHHVGAHLRLREDT